MVDSPGGDDQEQGLVNGVDAFSKDGSLSAALAQRRFDSLPHRARQERPRILKMVARHHAAQRLAWHEWFAVAGIDVADFALWNGHQRDGMDAIL
jgi:LPS sulfotransferase NodH